MRKSTLFGKRGFWLLLLALVAAVPAARGQEVRIAGRVTDPEGAPVIGANVVVEATGRGTTTDAEGNYVLAASPTAVLSFSFLGCRSQSVRVGNRTVVDVVLLPEATDLDEVVVVGYGTQKKENLTGAVSSVTAEALRDRPNSNLARSIQGVMPNVNISFADSRPGRGADINIRGLSVMTDDSNFKAASPFILIDGVPGDLNTVNPSDVESISVLKDAASAAIYGARGAYGVMLIKTKSGRAGKTSVSVGVNYSFSRPLPSQVPDIVTDPFTYMTVKNEAWTGYNNTTAYAQSRLDYALALRDDPSLPRTVAGANGYYEYYHSNNWYEKLYSPSAPQVQADLGLSGGSEKVQYYLSMGYVNQKGVYAVNPDTYSRFKLNGKITVRPNDHIEFYNYTDGTRADNDFPTWFGNGVNVWRYMELLTTPLAPEYNPDGTHSRETFFSAYLRDGGRGLKQDVNVRNTTGFNLTPGVRGLSVKGDFTYSYTGYDQNERFKRVRTSNQEGVNDYYLGVNRVRQTRQWENYYVLNLYADYQRQFGRHAVYGLAGMNYEKSSLTRWWAQRDDVAGDAYSSLNLATGTMNLGETRTEWAVNGYFVRLKYNFDERYLFEMNGRYDLTSRFPRSSRGGFFPSASAAWRVNREAFMKGTEKWLSDLKLRASYGTLGNQQVAEYSFYEKMTTSQIQQIIGSERPLAVSTPGLLPVDPTWEKSSTLDVGLDLGFFGQKLTASFDYYVTDVKDMLTKGKTLPSVVGAAEPKENAADVRTRGWDLSLKYSDGFRLLQRPFGFNVSVVVSDNYTEVTKFDNPARLFDQFYVGKRFGEIWGLETLGFYQPGDDLNAVDQSLYENPKYPGGRTYGDLKWRDRNGDGRIDKGASTVSDPGDFRKIGNAAPRYHYGFTVGFDWLGFDVSALFQGVGKRDYYPGPEAAYFWGVFNRPANNVPKHLIGQYWTPERPDAYFPKMRGYMALATNRPLGVPQTRYLQNAAYLRFKNLTVGYTLPSRLTQKLGLSRVRVYFSGENLATFTGLHKAFDPEALREDADYQGWGDGLTYPISQVFSFGLDLNF